MTDLVNVTVAVAVAVAAQSMPLSDCVVVHVECGLRCAGLPSARGKRRLSGLQRRKVGCMTNYARMYRWGITPWERYREAAATSIGTLLDREQSERSRPLGRALDLGCGRGQYTPELASRGWAATGIDYVPAAIDAAKRKGAGDVTYVVGDVTDLPSAGLARFDFFLDIGCFQGFRVKQRVAVGRGVSALANPGATLLMMAFGRTWLRSLIGGVSQAEVEAAFPDWELIAVEPAQIVGLDWPMNKTAPQWYRLRRS